MKTLQLYLFILLCVPFFSSAQTNGTISGVTIDATGTPEADVHIYLASTIYGTSSGIDGSFELRNIPPGNYLLFYSKIGFREGRKSITVETGQDLNVEISLIPSTYQLDDVAVYGQERQTEHAIRLNVPLSQVPLSINIVANEILGQQQAINLEDALKNVSSVSKFGSYGLSDNINIRGFDIGLAGAPENFRVNGVMMRTPYSDYVEEVQVLKGPASILYGDVEPGGIINFVTKKPLGYDHAGIRFQVGEYGLFRPSIDVGGKLADNLSYRLNTVYQKSNSFRDEVFSRQFMIAPSLLWNIDSNTTLNLDGLFMSNETTIDWGMPVGMSLAQAETLDDSNFYGYPDGTSKGENNTVMATFTHRFTNKWKIRNVTSYSNQPRLLHDVYPVFDSEENNVNFGFGDYRERSRTNTFSNALDLTGVVTTAKMEHKLLLGVDYSRITRPVVFNFIFPIEQTTSLENPIWENTMLSSAPILDDDELPFTHRFGLTVQDLVSVFDEKVHLLLGGRYSTFSQGFKFRGDAVEPDDYSDRTESKFTPRLGITYEPIKGTTLYGSYAESFSSIAPDPGRGLTDPEPLIGQQVEFGVKQSLLNDRLGVTLSYFDLNRNNVLQFDIIDGNGSISDPSNFRANQSGEHNSRGIELDLNGKLKSNWQVLTAFSYFKTKVINEIIQEGDSEPVDFTGKELPNNPNTKLSVWTYYTLERGIPGLSFGGGLFYQGDMFGDRLNTVENTIGGFTRVDLSVAYQFNHLKFQLNANNIGNVKTFQRSIFGSYVPQFPRRILASISYKL